jgi:hypothetical protein
MATASAQAATGGVRQPAPARPRSVAGRAAARHARVRWVFTWVLAPSCLCFPFGLFVLVPGIGLWMAWLTLADVAAWIAASVAARRMRLALPPGRAAAKDYGVGDDWTRVVPAGSAYRAMPRLEVIARGSPRDARDVIARNLVRRAPWVLVYVAAFAVAALPLEPGIWRTRTIAIRTARVTAESLRSAAFAYKRDHDGHVPSVHDLRREGYVERELDGRDPWGERYEVRECGDDILVVSAGRDRKLGTQDDLVVPTR